jgi:hypothetical protein
MLSSLPKLLDKNFVVGFFLPGLLAVFATAWAFLNLAVFDPIRSLVVTEKIVGNLTYVALITSVLSILLMAANHIQYRLYTTTLLAFAASLVALPALSSASGPIQIVNDEVGRSD